MFNKLFNKSVSILLTFIFIFGLIPTMVFAQPVSQMPEALQQMPGVNKSAFDSHFSKADREINPDRWLSEAQFGITQAIQAWEISAAGFYDNPVLFEEVRNQLIKWSQEELEARFSQWLIGRFFGEAAEKALMEVSSKLSNAQKSYSWHLDENGNILFDDKTGNPLIIRPEDREFSRDLLTWRDEADKIVKNNSADFSFALEKLYTELLAYIPQEMRESMNLLIKETGANISGSLKREFENIAAREERILTSRRTRDIWSLRKQSDDEAARLFTQNLIAETEKACAHGIEELNTIIEAAYASTGDLVLMGEEWLILYKEQFDRGLKAWEEAEERFFIRRIEWEQDSFKLFSEGEKIWEEAFILFQEQQRNWELQAKALFEDGETLFINISEDFEKSIAEAKKEFELNMAMRIGEGTTKVKALIDMYLICSSAALTAKEHLEYWEKQPGYEAEVNKSKAMYDSYMEKALDARDRILENYAEILGTGALKDILSPNVSSEDFFLDEYQIALIRAKSLVLYWERKTEIAEAVISYGQEYSAGRMTEGESLRAWESAKTEYNESLAAYEAELAKLTEIGNDLQKQQKILQELAYKLQEEEEKLNRLNTEYYNLVSKKNTSQSYLYLIEMNIKYNLLIEEYKDFLKKDSEANFNDVINHGMNWDMTVRKETAQELLNLLNEDDDNLTGTDELLRLAAKEILTENISGAEWYLKVNNTNLTEKNIYEQLVIDISEAGPEKEDFCKGLLDLYLNMAPFIDFIIKENWQETVSLLESLFSNYGIVQADNILPNAEHIYEAIIMLSGNPENNFSIFMQELDNCFIIIPEWLEYEIFNWQTAIIKYFAANLYNSTEDKNWRQFLSEEYIENIDLFMTSASSKKEGEIKDALFIAEYFTDRLNAALTLFSMNDYVYPDKNSEELYDSYINSLLEINYKLNIITNLFYEIGKSGNAYELSLKTFGDIENQINTAYKALNDQEIIYANIREEYFKEAEKYIGIGSLYDTQYSTAKRAHENADQKRFEYEKQDAIQRWASTAYLELDLNNLENCRTNLTKAQTILTILSELYNDESNRTYNNTEYELLYAAYQQNFSKRIAAQEAYGIISSAITQEYNNEKIMYEEYKKALYELGYIDSNYYGYSSNEDLSKWIAKDLITINNDNDVTRFAFSTDNGIFTGIDTEKAEELNAFFSDSNNYEEAIRELSHRMEEYFTDSGKFRQWSLARDYLLLSLMESNPELELLKDFYSGKKDAVKGGPIGDLKVQTGGIIFYDFENVYDIFSMMSYTELNYLFNSRRLPNNNNTFDNNINKEMKNAWERLSAEEKADLEFYIILTLTGNENNYCKGFSLVYTQDTYQYAYDYANYYYKKAKNKLFSGLYTAMINYNNNIKGQIYNPLSEINTIVNNWINRLGNNISSINYNYEGYLLASKKIIDLEGIKTDGSYITWDDIQLSLETANKTDKTSMSELQQIWVAMQEENDNKYTCVLQAIEGMFYWSLNEENKNKTAFYSFCEKEIEKQKNNELIYLTAVDDFFADKTDNNSLRKAAMNAYGNSTISLKNQLSNIYTVLLNDISIYSKINFDLYEEFKIIGDELMQLTVDTLSARYTAEYAAREIEWNRMIKDINDKYDEWQNTAALIFENGRNDWTKSFQKMEQAYLQWRTNFQEEYNRVNDEWNIAYLAGLEDKESWLAMAASAADQASSEAFLSLVGAEGERLSRMMDTREPFGIRDAVPEAQALMAELLRSSGIINMYTAFGAINNIANTSSTIVMKGMGGCSAMDANLAKTAAADLARQTNAEISDRETRIFAFNAYLAAEDAIKKLEENVTMANQNFRSRIDDYFIFTGLWGRSGNDYRKEIIKGSTLFTPVIATTAMISGYKDYSLEAVSLKTNIDENFLATLNTVAMIGIIENVFFEVELITTDIFGNGVTGGKFGEHIGKAPDFEKDKNDKGEGELGRLLSAYFYWGNIEAQGLSEYMLAPWDKRIWNDEGSWFKSPSLRSIGTIAAAVVSTVFTAGGSSVLVAAAISTSSDLLFNTLDVAGGYKTWDEGLFNVGKTFVTNLATGNIGQSFNGVNGIGGLTQTAVNSASSTLGKIATQTVMTATQTFTTGIVSSAIGGITYSRDNGLGFSHETIITGINNMFTNTLTSMASTLTTSSLTYTTAGEKLFGFSKLNIEDVEMLNKTIGSLAGQGVNYALGNDFTLNVLNFGMFNKNIYNTGLLELHLGRDGTTMNFGTGGADISYHTLQSAIDGIKVLNVNSKINKYVKENDDIYHAEFLRIQYGFGDDKQVAQLWDILKGEAKLKSNEEGDLNAHTTVDENGKKIVTIGGYQANMSTEEIFRLGSILGQEAHRDGYTIGQIDASGNIITKESAFNELKDASIARIMMSDRINEDYKWFYNYNTDFAFESDLLKNANKTGDYSLFDDNLHIVYKNDEDYFFQRTSTRGQYQNQEAYRNIPLFNADTQEIVNEINEQRRLEAYERYILDCQENDTTPDSIDIFSNDTKTMKYFGYNPVNYISLRNYGCKFMSTQYLLEAITGINYDTLDLHNSVKENKQFTDLSLLSTQDVADILNSRSNGNYEISIIPRDTSININEQLYKMEQSEDMYLAIIKVRGASGGYHFVAVDSIDFKFISGGNMMIADRINVSNSWNDINSRTGYQSYTLSDIHQWEFFKVTPTYNNTSIQ